MAPRQKMTSNGPITALRKYNAEVGLSWERIEKNETFLICENIMQAVSKFPIMEHKKARIPAT